jgi:mono/diheme cytochrome c family protein
VGPNLDELKPSFDAVVSQVTNGGGGMPAFADQLSEQEINDLAAYVTESTSG